MAGPVTKVQPVQPVNKKQSLGATLAAGQKQIATTATSGNPQEPLDEQSASYYLGEMKKLNEEYSPTAPPETQKSLANAMARAEQLYQEKATRNEWLEVAQMIGRAGTQFAAAQAGMKSGHNMSGLDMGSGIDYGSRTDRAFREYQQSLGNAKDLASMERLSSSEQRKLAEDKREGKQRYLEKGLGAALEYGRQDVSERNQDRRVRQAQEAEDRREATRVRAANIKDVEGEQKSLAERLNAAQTVVNQLGQMEDLSGKSADQIEKTLGPAAGKAGIDLAPLKAALEEQETRPRILGGRSKEEDQAAKKAILDAEIQKIRKMIADAESRKKELLGSSKSAAPANNTPPQGAGGTNPPAPEVPAADKSYDDAQLTAYSKQYNMSEEEARKFLESQGYTYKAH